MLRKPLLTLFFALLLAGVFFFGITQLFMLRYEIGDVYPPYSTLRADPLGTKAIAEALDELPGVDMQRNFRRLPRFKPEGPVTLVYAGVPQFSYWGEDELLAFDRLVGNGSRAVFTFLPVENSPTPAEEKLADKEQRERKEKRLQEQNPEAKKRKKKPADHGGDKKDDKKKADDKSDDSEDAKEFKSLIPFEKVATRWGFSFKVLPREKTPYERQASLIEPGGKLESDIPWHSALYFTDLKPQWKVLYMCGTMPVVIERKYGSGSIILAADSFLVSNEGLRKERHPKLLSRIFSGPSPVVFDEEHNGIRENPGIATLARKYRMHGVVVTLALLAILFVWKNAVRFIPSYASETGGDDVIAGKESSEGFINLLRRSIRADAIFDTCVAEWRKAFAQNPRVAAKAAEIIAQEQAQPPRSRNPVGAYRTIAQALSRKT